MNAATLIFPHQLFKKNPAVLSGRTAFLVEEPLFFQQYRFHKRKIAYHRSSMKFYESHLQSNGINTQYIEANNKNADVRKLVPYLKQNGITEIHLVELTDDWLEKRLKSACNSYSIDLVEYTSPMFLNTSKALEHFFSKNGKLRQTEFYIQQRKSRNILIDNQGKPIGGKWTYDKENRLKYPKDKFPPEVRFPEPNHFHTHAVEYTQQNYSKNPGIIDLSFTYPTTFEESRQWLQDFLEHRFTDFGPYEDAIVEDEHFLHHSGLTAMLNVGLLTPKFILEKTLDYSQNNSIPLNSLEGFIRQLIGWREFIRGVYVFRGGRQRSTNFWNFSKTIPSAFYKGTTGITPVDTVIRKVVKTGYCHHIERLMVLGNFMLLCEINPDEVYRWFMELFIDAYDWVMTPNIYGMSQFADGGLMATKPYISGSNYIVKMSNFSKGEWQKTWDGLFWRFLHVHRDFFQKNPRLGMLVRNFDNMTKDKQKNHLYAADYFMNSLK
jgi:deoxyribodipyrimidine photolyase-related protein